MDVNFEILYHESVVKEDIPALPSEIKKRIKKSIESKLTTQPELFGKPLRGSLKNYRRLRVGDYRIIFRIEEATVKIFIITHRTIVYGKIFNRI